MRDCIPRDGEQYLVIENGKENRKIGEGTHAIFERVWFAFFFFLRLACVYFGVHFLPFSFYCHALSGNAISLFSFAPCHALEYISWIISTPLGILHSVHCVHP